MKLSRSYRPQDIRNIALVGHGGVGKTTLAEALLHRAGAIARMGSIGELSTVADFEPEAHAHGHSTSSSLLFGTWEGKEINIIDTPGHPELIGQALAALSAVETAVIVVDAAAGVEMNTRRLFDAAGELGLARMIVVNRIDQNLGGLSSVLGDLRAQLGPRLHAINLPMRNATDVIDCFDQAGGHADFGNVGDAHREMLESSIELDDALVERYFAGEPIDLAARRSAFVDAMVRGHVIPVLFTAAKSGVGVSNLLHILAAEGPSPAHARPRRVRHGDAIVEIPCDPMAPFIAQVFKVTNDPHTGRLAMIRILQGQLDASTLFVAASDKKPRKAGQVLKIEGRERSELNGIAYAGDIVALAKVEGLHVDQILHAPTIVDDYTPVLPRYPSPTLAMAISATDRKDDLKLATALAQLAEEDPTLFAGQDPDTHELVIRGLGDLHLGLALERLKGRYRIDVTTRAPRAA